MSELIHKKDRGVMIPVATKDFIECRKCGFKVRKTQILQKYQQDILEIPVGR
jgi:hypothetical protein